MKIEFYRPLHKVLQRYIEGYYFISPGDDGQGMHYWTFPNNFFIVSVCKDAQIAAEPNKITVSPAPEKNVIANFVSRYTSPIEVVVENGISEITIYFKPLAIHYFIENAAALLEQGNGLDFQPFPDFIAAMENILLETDRAVQQHRLEDYWISKLDDRAPGLMEKILAEIESDRKIEEIAQQNNVSRQYLSRLFTRETGKSPSEFRRINRFRNAISNQKNSRNLTELSYESLFYDQSHLIKDFKQLTNISPYAFFKKVDTSSEYIWLFI
jgi:AraC-like DNA-binding protein